jgi:hypothetical protein
MYENAISLREYRKMYDEENKKIITEIYNERDKAIAEQANMKGKLDLTLSIRYKALARLYEQMAIKAETISKMAKLSSEIGIPNNELDIFDEISNTENDTNELFHKLDNNLINIKEMIEDVLMPE